MFVDRFRKKEIGIHILTHAHCDHVNTIPKNFNQVIYCSPQTKIIVKNMFQHVIFNDILIVNKSCKIENKLFYIFNSHHCVGSIGFYVDNHIYFGDGRPDIQTIQYLYKHYYIQSIYHDTFWKNYPNVFYDLPCVQTSQKWIDGIIKSFHTENIVICIPHFGSLEHLPKHITYNINELQITNNIPNQVCVNVFHLLKLKHKPISNIYITRNKKKNYKKNWCYIRLSCLWWFHNNDKKPTSLEPMYIEPNVVRIFITNHASPKEIQLLLSGV